jgi:hypothetical protein
MNTTPLYSPALVAFLPLNDTNQIGWVPLAPGDPYAPRYYDANWQPYYLTRTEVVPTRLVNLAVPSAVTVVPVDYFGRPIDPRVITRVDPRVLTQVRPVLDPLLVTPLRNAVVHSAWGRGKIDLPPGIAKKLFETPVITSVAPQAPPFRKDLARALRVEPIPEKVKNEKLKIRDERQGNEARSEIPGREQAVQTDAARKQQMGELAAKAAQGDKDARRQAQQLEQEQRKQQLEVQKAQRVSQQAQREQQRQQAQGERVGRRAQQPVQREVPRPEMQPVPQQIERRQSQPRREVRPQIMRQPRQEAPRQQVQQQEPPQRVQQQQSAPAVKQQVKQGPPAQPAAQPQGGGGKGKGKGKP